MSGDLLGARTSSSALSAEREQADAPSGAFADGTSALPAIADLLEYPDIDCQSKIAACANNNALTKFRSGIHLLALADLQELYTRTFDLNPVCALEVGYHLFGENYKRGEFLANLRETEAPFDLGQENQLPDYLPVLLRLLTKLDDEELRSSLISQCMVPAIEKMMSSFKDTENPYRYLLEAVRTTLQSEAGYMPIEAPPSNMRASLPVLTNDLLNSPGQFEVTRMREFAAQMNPNSDLF